MHDHARAEGRPTPSSARGPNGPRRQFQPARDLTSPEQVAPPAADCEAPRRGSSAAPARASATPAFMGTDSSSAASPSQTSYARRCSPSRTRAGAAYPRPEGTASTPPTSHGCRNAQPVSSLHRPVLPPRAPQAAATAITPARDGARHRLAAADAEVITLLAERSASWACRGGDAARSLGSSSRRAYIEDRGAPALPGRALERGARADRHQPAARV